MISEKHECIFVHIPKTGGQSVESIFLDLNGLAWDTRAPLLLRPNPDPAKGPERLAHLKAAEYLDLGYVDRAAFDRYFKFAFVRNPWDRLVSEYRYLGLEGEMPFRTFVTDGLAKLDDYSNVARHLVPQIDFLTDSRGAIIVDFVGRFEMLNDDFDTVARRLGLGKVDLPHRNSSSSSAVSKLRRLLKVAGRQRRRPYHEYYDDDLRRRVTDFYARDVEQFGYTFEGSFEPRPIV